MLSDAGSKVIRAFGILNTNIPPDHPMMYGIPWPGDFLVAPDGTVRDKVFLPNYEHRPSATEISQRNFGSDGLSNAVNIGAGVLQGVVKLSSGRCFPGQELGLSLDLTVAPGWHIYGKPLPASYQAVELLLDGDVVGEYSLDFPAPSPMPPDALGETLPIYSGAIAAKGKLGVKWSPPMPAKFLAPLGETIEPGLHKIRGTLKFQACSDTVCEAPRATAFELPLTIETGVAPAPRK